MNDRQNDDPPTVRLSDGSDGTGPRQPRPAAPFASATTSTMPGSEGGSFPGSANKPPAPRGRLARRIAAVVVLGTIALGVGYGVSLTRHFSESGGIVDFLDSIKNPRGQFARQDRVNILLIGKDYNRYISKRDRSLNGMPTTRNARSDSIIMMSLDLESKRVSAISIPRDTWVKAPDGETGKINGTYARGGAKLLRETVGELLGVKPDYYIAIKADAVKNMVDTVGGVTVETLDKMKYDDEWGQLHVDLPAGRQVINGTQAIGFARFREADIYQRHPDGTAVRDRAGNALLRPRREIEHSKEEGDPRRMARQQQLIRAIVSKAKEPVNLLRAGKIIDTAYEQLETDLKKEQLTAIGALFRNLEPDQMLTATLEGRGVLRGTYRFEPDERKKKAMVDWLLKGDETAANRLTLVAVQNGTEVRGVAGKVAEKLREEGYDAIAGNFSKGETGEVTATSIIYGKASVAPRAKRIAEFLGVQATQVVKQPKPDVSGTDYERSAENADITIVLGRDIAVSYGERSARR